MHDLEGDDRIITLRDLHEHDIFLRQGEDGRVSVVVETNYANEREVWLWEEPLGLKRTYLWSSIEDAVREWLSLSADERARQRAKP